MVRPLDDYTSSSGYLDGEEICPVCGEYWIPNSITDRCVSKDGTVYENITDADPSEGPYFCPECYKLAKVEQMQRDNQTLETFNE